MKTKVICVYNKQEIFDKVVKHNKNLKDCEIFACNNTKDNVAITKLYNKFIDENILTDEDPDFWCLFIHQDFGIEENIDLKLNKLDKICIYGPVGAKFYRGLFFDKHGLKRRLFNVNYGKILQGNNDFNFHEYGVKLKRSKIVDAIDCCCIIIHSSLIKKHNLHFDNNLSFHMYAEELCYSAKKNHRVKTKVIQLNCYHLGTGNLNEEFQKSAQYLKDKFNIERVPSTCPN